MTDAEVIHNTFLIILTIWGGVNALGAIGVIVMVISGLEVKAPTSPFLWPVSVLTAAMSYGLVWWKKQ